MNTHKKGITSVMPFLVLSVRSSAELLYEVVRFAKNYDTAFRSKVKGQRLQLIPFFKYLLQHLFFGFIQLLLHAVEQALAFACIGTT